MEARRASQASVAPLTTPPERKPPSSTVDDSRPNWFVGDYVRVDSSTAPGINRPDGYGFVVAVRGVGADTEIDVQYDAGNGGHLHKGISIEEAVTASLSFTFGSTSSRQHLKRRKVESPNRFTYAVPTSTTSARDTDSAETPQAALLRELRQAASTNRGKGWRRKDLKLGENKRLNQAEKQQLLMEAMLMDEFLAREKMNRHTKRGRGGTFGARKTKHNPITITYLVQHAWGMGKSYLRRLRNETTKAAKTSATAVPVIGAVPGKAASVPRGSVIESRPAARRIYTAKEMYINASCQTMALENLDSVSSAEYRRRRATASKQWEKCDSKTKALWENRAREHDERFPSIKPLLLEQLRQNPSISWERLAGAINNWCSASAIQRWLTSYLSYGTYSEMISPLLSVHQKTKHLAFARRLRGNWYRGSGKFLLINYDEKWFWGLVLRAAAKECPELGLNPRSFQTYHKKHINKVMVVAFTGFAYVDSMENGGVGLKLGCFRAEAPKIAAKMVRQSRKTEDGVRQLIIL